MDRRPRRPRRPLRPGHRGSRRHICVRGRHLRPSLAMESALQSRPVEPDTLLASLQRPSFRRSEGRRILPRDPFRFTLGFATGAAFLKQTAADQHHIGAAGPTVYVTFGLVVGENLLRFDLPGRGVPTRPRIVRGGRGAAVRRDGADDRDVHLAGDELLDRGRSAIAVVHHCAARRGRMGRGPLC